jgi:hypothetical protein
VGYTSEVGSFGVHSIAPPRLNRIQSDGAILWVLQCKEDDDDAEGITCIQSSGQDNYRKPSAWSEFVGLVGKLITVIL